MDLRNLGGLLVLLGVVALVVGYVVPLGVAITLGWIGVVIGVVLIIVTAVTSRSGSRF